MKKYASKTLKVIALCYTAFPVVYPLTAALLFDIAPHRLITLKLSPIYWIVVLLAVVSGLGLWEMRRWGWYLFITANFLVVYENAYIAADLGESLHKGLAFLLSVTLVTAFIFRIGSELRVPYFLPDIRWWESDPARKLLIPAHVVRETQFVEAEILDLALEGCFVKSPEEFRDDELVTIQFTALGHLIECKGNVVWRAASTVTHPKGVGIRFVSLSRVHRRKLKVVLQRLKRMQIFKNITQPLEGSGSQKKKALVEAQMNEQKSRQA